MYDVPIRRKLAEYPQYAALRAALRDDVAFLKLFAGFPAWQAALRT